MKRLVFSVQEVIFLIDYVGKLSRNGSVDPGNAYGKELLARCELFLEYEGIRIVK